MLLIFLGMPGSGKGTISKKLVDKYDYKHISTGDIFRNIISKKTELGLKVKEIIEKGNLVNDETTWEVAKEVLENIDLVTENFILDGYPRNINQNKHLFDWFNLKKFSNYKIIYFDVSEKVVIQRITGRLTCKKCSRIYHKQNNPPKKENICDYDNENLISREDDKIENVKTRIKTYFKTTKPLVDFYSKSKNLITIDASNSIEITMKEIFKILKV